MTSSSIHPVGFSSQAVEIVRDQFPRGGFRAAIFDFDGTLSLLRRNWQDVMIPLMIDILADTGSPESREQLHEHVEEFVMRRNGQQTIYQMIQLAEEVKKRGGCPLDPIQYKHQYHDRLWQQVGPRIEAIRVGRVAADEMSVPGAKALLEGLVERNVILYLTSGTDLGYVKDELTVLGLDHFFGRRVYGALDEYRKFSKAMVINQVIREANLAGEQLIGFGDGYVEVEEIKKVGGLAIGVASNEETRQGINPWKRERLIRAGADIILGDYRERDRLFQIIGLA